MCLFQGCDVFNPELSDHALVYGILKIKATYHPSKIITFRNLLLFRSIKEELKYDLHMAPRHFGDTCISSIRSRISIVSGTIIY